MSTIEYPYYMSARILSRSRGHNAVAAAAYRSGQKLVEGVVDKSGLVDHFHLEDEHAEGEEKGVGEEQRGGDDERRRPDCAPRGGQRASAGRSPRSAGVQ